MQLKIVSSFLLTVLTCLSLSSAAVTGLVQDSAKKPLVNALAVIADQFYCRTDATGHFRIDFSTNVEPRIVQKDAAFHLSIGNGILRIRNLPQSSVRIGIYDLQGRQVYAVKVNQADGNCQVQLDRHRFASSLILTVDAGTEKESFLINAFTQTVKNMDGSTMPRASKSCSRAAAAGAVADTLVVKFQGLTPVSVLLHSRDTNLTITMQPLQALVARYSFDEKNGAVVIDSSSNGLFGTIYGAARTQGKYGTALCFPLASSRVLIPALSDYEKGALTIICWIKFPDTSKGPIQRIFGSGYYGVRSYKLELADLKLSFSISDQSGSGPWIAAATADQRIPFTEWFQCAVTYDGDVCVLYIDGQEIKRAPLIMPIPLSYNTMLIGACDTYDFGWAESFAGAIDELMIFNEAKTAEQIKNFYLE
jgi:hypothetical protein